MGTDAPKTHHHYSLISIHCRASLRSSSVFSNLHSAVSTMASQQDAFKVEQNHGKSNVRVARIWKNVDGSAHDFVEWNVAIKLLSDCIPAYTHADNSPIVATDTIKNTVMKESIHTHFKLGCSLPPLLLSPEFGFFFFRFLLKLNPALKSFQWRSLGLFLELISPKSTHRLFVYCFFYHF